MAPAEAPNLRQLTSLITAVVVICALDLGREVLMPVTLAVLLSFLVAPMVELLERLRLGQVPSVVIAVVLALAVMGGLGTLIGAQVAQLGAGLPQYQAALEQKAQRVQQATVGRVDGLLGSGSNLMKRLAPPPDAATGASGASGAGRASAASAIVSGPAKQQDRAPMPVAVQEPPASSFALARRFLAPVVSPLETAGIVLVVAIFILLQREDLRDRLIRLFGSRDLHRATTAMDEAAHRLSRYFLTQFGVNVGVGIVISTGLAIIGVPGAILFGVLTALFRFVPYVGTWIGAVLALVLAATGPDWTMLLWTIGLFGATDLITAQVIEPLLYGHSTGLSPVAVIVAAIFWSWIWGPVGLILSTPLTLCLVILGRHVDKLEFLEVLLGDRPPLSPSANFYQRILADDPEEALRQAETLLKDMTLVEYYDTVMLEGLQLAHNDMMRGVILPDQLARIREALLDIIDGFEDIDEPVRDISEAAGGDRPSPGLTSAPEGAGLAAAIADSDATAYGGPVLCIAGRGGLDELVAAATVQVLSREGIQAQAASYAQFSRKKFSGENLSAVTTICVTSLDAGQSNVYLRILLRRLQKHAPAATLILGFLSETSQDTEEHRGTAAIAASSFSQVIALIRRERAAEMAETTGRSDGVDMPPSPFSPESLSPDAI
ncbi:AI-2E family transporter [Paraburkholderia sp. CNPSo 3274]|uniref:AI-2E family transporter n=1 Tax=Paraburkholderia sp. CNPSo 3274 TaxID=2940932 RepID=UPI0020B77DCF|nr:AI-2E family transporter [Paraburkholderia sp. CNPSo 3274]MCP3712515.1 AI-2E family transporter [Paraburkholderia sp. CNPSo 3274]